MLNMVWSCLKYSSWCSRPNISPGLWLEAIEVAKHPSGVESSYSAPAQEQLVSSALHGAQFTLPNQLSHPPAVSGEDQGICFKIALLLWAQCEYKNCFCIDISGVFSSLSLCGACRKDRSDREVALWSRACSLWLVCWLATRSSHERNDSEGVLDLVLQSVYCFCACC